MAEHEEDRISFRDPEVEKAWAAEVERRQAQIDSGEVSLLSGSEVLAKLKAEFQD